MKEDGSRDACDADSGKIKPWEEIHDIRTDSVIPLGGTELAVCQTPGHTPGSVVVLETKQNYLFTGDAIGSGCGVWMQVPGGTSLEEYYDGLVGLMVWLVKRGGRMKFFGGHHTQVFESTAHPVTIRSASAFSQISSTLWIR